ncbi:DUF1439 domain-containing protein [Ramlibacter sp. G-1-2-2]|uniref:DUF1439 domain-containing protein n=1 Tax=Ramlibacter agri TaxID=2728837 RepID=A0A848H6M9_9BURK|nr:DUF1439 domain-containing protein [Ramlibacter agri]NML46204.1 DUF1439 domain-containing protein [Ramlibacter agri]
MQRRLLFSALACWPLTRLLAQEQAERPRLKISAAELHKTLSARFPVRLDLAGLLQLRLDAPALLLLPARQKLGATLQLRATDVQSRQVQAGEMDVAFRLRYEASDRTLRARQLEVLDLRWPGMPPETVAFIQAFAPAAAANALGEIVLHQFAPGDLALADTMGLQPEQITVAEDGIVIWLGNKPVQ